MKKQIVISLLSALALTACATPASTAYGPAAGPRSAGFSDQRIDQTRFRVTYRAPAQQPGMAEDAALLRAADIARAEGYDWFVVTNRFIDTAGGGGPTLSLGTGGGSFGGNTGVGVGLGTSFNLGGGAMRSVSMDVRLGRGPRPEDAYDAADVQRTVGPRFGLPRG
jgi:hypothetical protein